MSDSLRDAQLRQEYRAEIMRGYQAALCNSDVPGWTLGDEVAKVADNLLAAHPAAPAPQPALPVCPNCEGEHFTCGSCGIVLDATAAPDVQVGYEAVYEVIRGRRPGLPGPIEVNALIWSGVHAFINAMGINPKVTLQVDDQQVASAAPQPVVDRDTVAAALHDYDMAHSWGDERFCPQYACVQVYPPRADAVLALLNGAAAEAIQNGRREVSAGAVEEQDALRCKHCGDEIEDTDDGPWMSLGEFGGTGTGAYAERSWCADAPDHQHSPDYSEAEVGLIRDFAGNRSTE